MKKKIFLIISVVLAVVLISAACSSYAPDRGGNYDYYAFYPAINENEYNEIIENPEVLASEIAESTFSLSVNTASYSILRRCIENNYTISKNQVRIEEMVNYFKYDFTKPQDDETLKISGFLSDCPWNDDKNLLTVNVRAKDIVKGEKRNNLVFLIDVSGSMYGADRLDLLQSAFLMLIDNLEEDDCVSIVTYAGSERIVLDGAKGFEKQKIRNAVEDLTAGGSTAGGKGIISAYALARKNYIEDGNNRVILATDGDFNVGVSSQEGLAELITEERQKSESVYLSVLGFGMGNLKDSKMETLASNGNGNYAYIDNLTEAKRALVEDLNGTLVTVARDAKAQVVFNKDSVYSYRLLGYENKLLSQEDWENAEKDAGEIGAGLCATAVYEIEFADKNAGNFAEVNVKYKSPDTQDNTQYNVNCNVTSESFVSGNDDIIFITAVIEAALVLRNSDFKKNANLQNVIIALERIENLDDDIYKTEFLELMKKYQKR